MTKIKVLLAAVIVCTWTSYCCAGLNPLDATSLDEYTLYDHAQEEVKLGNLDFAFLNFRTLLNDFPNSKLAERSLFAIGEYHFINKDYREANSTFFQLIDKYPDSSGTIFALCYLLQIAKDREEQAAVEQLTKTIVTFHRLSLVFRNSQEYTYQSALMRKHRVIYYIDKVEFYINGELFAQIPY